MSRTSDFEGDGGATDVYPDRTRETGARGSIIVTAGNVTRDVGPRAVVGSSAGADLVLADPTVSRLHAELELAADGVWLRDMGSTNGSFVGDLRVERARLPDGAVVRLGATKISVGRSAKSVPVELWPGDTFGPLLGRSQRMRELFAKIHRIAPTDATILVQGETGTGKELVAQAIHEHSLRASKPLVIVDCSSLPEHLVESELFGHARGAFTGAHVARAGAIEAADRGTVFLDEIGELPMAVQPKLLRALESRQVRRVGESNYRTVDVRFIAATHRDIAGMINRGAFREDLYFRLAVMQLSVPALRDRPDDISLLVERFIGPGRSLTPEVIAELATRPWRGNVRELRNFVDRAMAMGADEALALGDSDSRGASLDASELPRPRLDRPFKEVRDAWLEHLERTYVAGLLAKCNGNVTQVSALAGLDRSYIHRLVRKHDL